MLEVLPENAVIRKLWIGETAGYRGHLLRLDQQSRRSRFGGTVSDETIAKYVATLSASTPSCTAASLTACCAAAPNCGRSDCAVRAGPRRR
jgi:hypothetical protein